jgi:transposase-like protein
MKASISAGLLRWLVPGPASQTGAVIRSNVASCAPAGYRFPREVIAVAVRWYLRYGLSYRDVEELLAERGVTVDHVTGVPVGTDVHAEVHRRRPTSPPRGR